jgi:hypothetical protein
MDLVRLAFPPHLRGGRGAGSAGRALAALVGPGVTEAGNRICHPDQGDLSHRDAGDVLRRRLCGTPIPGASLGLNAWSWLDSLWRPLIVPVLSYADPGVLLPAAVLLLSGLGMLLVAGLRELRR